MPPISPPPLPVVRQQISDIGLTVLFSIVQLLDGGSVASGGCTRIRTCDTVARRLERVVSLRVAFRAGGFQGQWRTASVKHGSGLQI